MVKTPYVQPSSLFIGILHNHCRISIQGVLTLAHVAAEESDMLIAGPLTPACGTDFAASTSGWGPVLFRRALLSEGLY